MQFWFTQIDSYVSVFFFNFGNRKYWQLWFMDTKMTCKRLWDAPPPQDLDEGNEVTEYVLHWWDKVCDDYWQKKATVEKGIQQRRDNVASKKALEAQGPRRPWRRALEGHRLFPGSASTRELLKRAQLLHEARERREEISRKRRRIFEEGGAQGWTGVHGGSCFLARIEHPPCVENHALCFLARIESTLLFGEDIYSLSLSLSSKQYGELSHM